MCRCYEEKPSKEDLAVAKESQRVSNVAASTSVDLFGDLIPKRKIESAPWSKAEDDLIWNEVCGWITSLTENGITL